VGRPLKDAANWEEERDRMIKNGAWTSIQHKQVEGSREENGFVAIKRGAAAIPGKL